MRVEFLREDEPLWVRVRDVLVEPREGERLVWHGYIGNKTRHFLVTGVSHVFDDRRSALAPDKVCVVLREVPGPGSSFRALEPASLVDVGTVQRNEAVA